MLRPSRPTSSKADQRSQLFSVEAGRFVRRADQIMQNNLIRIPRKAFKRASQGFPRSCDDVEFTNKRASNFASNWMYVEPMVGSVSNEIQGRERENPNRSWWEEGQTMILLAAEGEEEEMKRG